MSSISVRTVGFESIVLASVACACAAAGIVLAYHYPLAPTLVAALFLLWLAFSVRWPGYWLAIIPSLLPITGLATWTGWFTFEELDLLVLGAAAGGYARMTWQSTHAHVSRVRTSSRLSLATVLVIGLLAASYGISLVRGIIDAGGFDFDWIGSYESSMNSVRICKSLALALLLWPLLRYEIRFDERRAINFLARGLALGLCGAALAALWERAAFTGVLNFSSDYRTTALFWEMHVGGAAFDGFLALTVPFVVWTFRSSSSVRQLGMALGLAALAAYASLTTFSRGVYVAIPAGLATLALLVMRQRPVEERSAPRIPAWRTALFWILATAAVYLVFRHGGYRALLAFVATVGVALLRESAARTATPRIVVLALIGGLAIGVVASAAAMGLPKGAYVLFATVFGWNVILYWRHKTGTGRPASNIRLLAFVVLIVSAATVSLEWGGSKALVDNAIALLLVLAFGIANSYTSTPWIAPDLRHRAISLGMLALLGVGIAVFGGGAYMGDRFSTSSKDLEARLRHWKDGIRMLDTGADWWFGKGLGRFPASYFFGAPDAAVPGSYHFHRDVESFLTLAGPRYPTSWGDLFRVAQRVSARQGPYEVMIDVRAPQDVQFHVEICEQHLLYNDVCLHSAVSVPANPEWQSLAVDLGGGAEIAAQPWQVHRLAFFALAVESSGRSLDLRNVRLIGREGRNLIVNGDFGDGMARWIAVSERYHLPWHIKNIALDVLFDQGIVGLVVFSLLIAIALGRLAFGAVRRHPIAPFLAASLVGFMCVGAFDSLLDVPRVAFLFYLLLLTSLGLSTPMSLPDKNAGP